MELSTTSLYKPKTYYPEINYLRGFAILAVISIHTSSSFLDMKNLSPLTIVYMGIDALSRFAVPAFVFISGFVLYNKYNDYFNIHQFYKKRLETTVPPYIIFTAFYILFTIFGSLLIGNPIHVDIIQSFFTGSSFYHMWYLITIIELYLLYPIILKLYTYSKMCTLIGAFLISVIYSKNGLPYCMFYFVLGIYVCNYYKMVTLNNLYVYILVTLGTVFNVCEYSDKYFGSSILPLKMGDFVSNAINMIYVIVVFLSLLKTSVYLSQSHKLRFIDHLGSYSFPIYLIHAAILYVLIMIGSELGFNFDNVVFYPSMMIFTLFGSIVFIKIANAFKIGTYIIGPTYKKM